MNKKILPGFDWLLSFAMLGLCAIGLVIIYSAGFDPQTGQSSSMIKQAVSMGIGFGAFLACVTIRPSFWRSCAWAFYVIGCLLLLFVLLKGTVAGGARRWLVIGPLRMQPAEFTKIALILLYARLFSSESSPAFQASNGKGGFTFKTLLFPAFLLGIPTILIMKEPDLGTALVHILIAGSMLFLAGIQRGTLIRLIVAGGLFAVPAWHMLKDYQKNRVLNFISPEADPLGTGYHAIQSKIAVGSGAVTGKGFMQGTQTQLRFLPEQTTDFIFSVLAEEWGFFGSLVILVLYAVLILRSISVASKCSDSFSMYVAYGVASMMFWHVFVNIGMVIGVVPVVGVTLKLLSYGGSSVIAAMAGIGLVAGFSVRRSVFSS